MNDMDAMIAKLLGWSYRAEARSRPSWRRPDGTLRIRPPKYSTSISDAWEILEFVKDKVNKVSVSRVRDGWVAEIGQYSSISPTAPMAICVTMLRYSKRWAYCYGCGERGDQERDSNGWRCTCGHINER